MRRKSCRRAFQLTGSPAMRSALANSQPGWYQLSAQLHSLCSTASVNTPSRCVPSCSSHKQPRVSTCEHTCVLFSLSFLSTKESKHLHFSYFLTLLSDILRVLSSPSRHLQGRQWERIPCKSLLNQSTFPSFCCKIHFCFAFLLT